MRASSVNGSRSGYPAAPVRNHEARLICGWADRFHFVAGALSRSFLLISSAKAALGHFLGLANYEAYCPPRDYPRWVLQAHRDATRAVAHGWTFWV